MSCKIDEMSWSEIIDKFGLYIIKEDAYLIMSEKGNLDKELELVSLLERFQNQNQSKYDEKTFDMSEDRDFGKRIREFFEQNAEYFDKVKYVMLTNLNCDVTLRNTSLEDYRKVSKQERYVRMIHANTLDALKDAFRNGINKSLGLVTKSESPDRQKDFAIITTERLIFGDETIPNSKIKQENLLRKSDVTIYEMLYQSPLEIFDRIDTDPNVKVSLEYAAVLNTLGKSESMVTEKILRETIRDNKENYVKQLADLVTEALENIDIEGLLIGTLQANLSAIDSAEISEDDKKIALDRLNRIMFVANKIFQKGIAENPQNIQEFNKLKNQYKGRIIGGQYITKNNVEVVINELMNGKCYLRDLSGNILELLGKIPTKTFLLNRENFLFAMKNNYMNDRKVFDMITECGECNTEVILYALGNNMLTKDELIDLYMQKNITLEQIRELEQKMQSPVISLDDVITKYKDEYETIHAESDDELAEQSNEFDKTFGGEESKSNETGKITEEKEKKAKKSFEELASQAIALKEPGFENEKVEEALIEMDSEEIETAMIIFYRNYLIDAKTALENCGTQAIQFFRPVDIRSLYQDKTITIDDINQVVRGMDGEKAIHFVCKVFPGKENETELNELMQTISVENVDRSRDLGTHRNKKGIISNTQGNIGVSAITYKYKFYESLDQDYSSTYYRNGYEVFELPNVKYKGTEEHWVVVEPMIDKAHNGKQVRAAQDKAMWIIPSNLWNKQKGRIIGKDYTIQTDVIRDLYDSIGRNQMTKMHHIISQEEKILEKSEEIKQGKVPKYGWPFRIYRMAKSGREYTPEEEKDILNLGAELELSMVRE